MNEGKPIEEGRKRECGRAEERRRFVAEKDWRRLVRRGGGLLYIHRAEPTDVWAPDECGRGNWQAGQKRFNLLLSTAPSIRPWPRRRPVIPG